uniref:Uncharacterized protein n=1 Tax=Cajanus cajan TaxID=3821 RepID=A0A151SS16_CAJCA|nr:hypothetical protein KK1_003848 [Cajanus cajan]
MSRVEGGKKSGEKENELLSKDVETINEAPCREKKSSTNSTSSKTALHDPKSKAKANKEDNLRKDKKSIWGWKPLKALSLTRNKRFNCCFTLQVHLIEGLPLSFNNYSLCVFWKRKDVLLATPPAKVIQGVAEFQQILAHTFSICGSKSGPHNSAKYEAKYFLVYASTPGAPKLDLGKHRVDLTRLLPLTLEELEEEKTSGKWTTTFRLSGTAKGAVMNVSFGYAIVPDNTSTPPNLFTSRVNSMPLMDPDTKPSQVERNVRRAGKETPGIESSKECEGNGFSIVDQGQGTNFSSNEHVKLEESIIKAVVDVHTVDRFDTDVIQVSFEDSAKHDSLDELNDSSRESAAVPEISNRMGVLCTKEIMQELESALNRVSDEFLSKLGIDHSPMGIKSVSSLPDLQKEYLIESEDVRSKQKVQMLVDLETEALMHEWRLNEKAFQHSPPKDFNGFGSPIYFLPEEPLPLPPLEEGMGPFLQTKDGGFLRSLNPSLFRNSKTGGRLIMQVSNPVVMPAEMGSRIMEILQCLASVGIEKLSMQANKLMPLEEITGKTMQQISWEAKSALEGTHRQFHLQHDLVTEQESTCAQKGLKGILPGGLKTDKFCSSSVDDQKGSEFASLEDLSPLAMDKIEALSVEGLRIQSGMSKEDAPSNIIAQTFGDISALQGKGVSINGSLGLDGAAALHFPKGEKKRGKGSGRKCGLLGNNFTVALMVQLRDPLRNYEAVGTPMLALIQVEREFVPPKHKIYRRVSEVGNINDEDDECEIVAKVEMKVNKEDKSSEEEAIPQFRITEVHVAGLKTEPEAEARKKKVWGTSRQQQSGSRWLIANGMGKNSNNLFMKSKPVSKTSAPTTKDVQHSDTLWSISSRIFGTGTRWKELAELNPHVRNPNIIIPNKTTRVS